MTRAFSMIAAAAFALPLPVSAENLTGEVTAVCTEGQGCACYDAVSPTDVLEVMGLPTGLPDGWAGDVRSQTVVIDQSTGQVYRTSAPRARINDAYGGQGECEPEPRPTEPVPLDGMWQWFSRGQAVSGCPPMMAGALAAGTETGPATRVSWQGAFDPRRLTGSLPAPEMAGTQPYEWRKLGPARWLSDNLHEHSCSDGTCVDMALSLSMALASPERITGLLSLRSRIDSPQAGGILASFGMADCQVRVRYEILRTGP